MNFAGSSGQTGGTPEPEGGGIPWGTIIGVMCGLIGICGLIWFAHRAVSAGHFSEGGQFANIASTMFGAPGGSSGGQDKDDDDAEEGGKGKAAADSGGKKEPAPKAAKESGGGGGSSAKESAGGGGGGSKKESSGSGGGGEKKSGGSAPKSMTFGGVKINFT